LPRLYYAAASQYAEPGAGLRSDRFFGALSRVSSKGVPAGSLLFSAILSIAALLLFGTFRRIVTYFVVPVHVVNILIVASVYRLRRRFPPTKAHYLTPGYPLVPAVYILVLLLFLLGAVVYNPLDTLIGVAMTSTGIPVYRRMGRSVRS